MKKFLKPGRVVIMLTGRHAGKKAVIVKVNYEGSKYRRFGHCLVAGIERYPRRVIKKMSDERIKRRIAIKPFVKYVNFNHFMPTRYLISKFLKVSDISKKFDNYATSKKEGTVDKNRDPLRNAEIKEEIKKTIKRIFQDNYKNLDLNDSSSEGLVAKFLFKPLRF